MDFEYRIFKFVPQVDRFVNEQMQFKLQECSYNKASTFEIDDDYADDYDFGLYQGDRSKARKHADNLIYKLCENQEYSIDEKEHMINMLVRDIERYILTTQLNSAQSDKHVKRLLKALLAVDKDLDVITIVCKYYQECMEYLQEVSYASIIKIDYKDLYIHAGDRALFIKNDYELALKFYELSELDWDGGEIKQQDIMWEMYADHAEGCCIVINWNKIRQYNTEKSVPLYRVLYLTENSGEYAITRTKNPHIKEFTRVKQYLNVLKDNAVFISTRKEALNIFGKLLSDIIYLFKDSSYSYEQEMRIIYSYDSVSDVFMHTETKYPLLFVYPDFPLQIEEIILAPKFIDRTRKIPYIQEQIEKMCDYIGGDMPIITNSNIDYR